MSDSVQPHRRQPTRLPRPWDSPGKNTGVASFKFFLLFDFPQFKYNVPKNRFFWVIILLGVYQVSWVFGLMSVINFSKWSSAVIISNLSFVSYNFSYFSSLLLLTYAAHLTVVPWFLNILSIFSSFFLCISVTEVSPNVSSNPLLRFSIMPYLLMRPSDFC